MASEYTTNGLQYLDTTPKSGQSIPSNEKPNAVTICKALKAEGYTKAGAQAVLANIDRESSFDPKALEGVSYARREIGGKGGYGLIQWTGQKDGNQRRWKLEKAANFDISTRDNLDFQIRYLISEKSGKAIANILKTENNPIVTCLEYLFLDVRSGSAIDFKNAVKAGKQPEAKKVERVQRRVNSLWAVQSVVDEVYGGTAEDYPPGSTATNNPSTSTANPDAVNAQSNATQSSASVRADDRLPIFTKDSFVKNTAQHFKKMLSGFVAFKLYNVEDKGTGVFTNDNLNEYWIPLFVILDIYNQYVSLLDGTQEPQKGSNTPGRKLTQFYTGYQDKNTTNQAYEKKCKFLTNEMHFSIDPMVCILPKPVANIKVYDSKKQVVPWTDNLVLSDTSSYAPGFVYKNGFHKNVLSAFERGLMRGGTDDILNILISCQFLQDELDKIVKSAKDSDQNDANDMVTFMRTVLGACNEAMGGINDLETIYDEQDDMFYIVDRKVTPALRNILPTISLTGIRSIVSNLTIESKISSNIGNMISVAAQGTGGHTKDNIGPLLEWNRGLLDRHIIHKAQKTDPNGDPIENRETAEDERLKKWTVAYHNFWEEFNGAFIADDGDYDRKAVANIKGYHKEWCQRWVVEKRSKSETDPIPAPGVIPIELSFTMMGIGGLKIGQAFLVEEGLLPNQYSDNFGFIITGLSHNIADGKWTTDVKTQFYSTKKPTPEEIAYFKEKYGQETAPYQSSSGGSSAPVVTGEGTGVPYNPVDAKLPGDGSVTIKGGTFNQSKLGSRRESIQPRLMEIITYAAKKTGVTFRITSAGQIPLPPTSGRNAIFEGNGVIGKNAYGTARHDNGYGVDGNIMANGKKLVCYKGEPLVQSFLRACRERGLHSIGVGQNYMGGVAVHLDIACGNSVSGGVFNNFSPNSSRPSWLKPLLKATVITEGEYKNTFKKSENLTAANGKKYYTRGVTS